MNYGVNMDLTVLCKRYPGECYSYDLSTGQIIKHCVTDARYPYNIGLVLDSPIHNTPINGMTYKVLYLSKEMVKRGHNYTFFICNRNFTSKEEVDALSIEGIKVHILDESLFYDAEYMSKLVLQEKIDVLQYETAQTFLKIGIPMKTRTDIPSSLVLHDLEVELFHQLGVYSEGTYLMDYVHYVSSNLADSVMTLTKVDQEKRILKHNLPREKTSVTPIGVDSSLPYVGPNLNEKIIGFVGNQLYEPNRRAVVYLIEEVLPIVHSTFADAEVKIIGNSSSDLRKAYEGRGDIIFTGVIQDDKEYIKELSSLSLGTCCIDVGTGMNVKIANYCAIGLPVILTPIARKGYEDISSLSIVEYDKHKVAKQIVRILGDEQYAKAIGSENNKLIFQYLS